MAASSRFGIYLDLASNRSWLYWFSHIVSYSLRFIIRISPYLNAIRISTEGLVHPDPATPIAKYSNLDRDVILS